MNKVILVGRIADKPQLRHTSDQQYTVTTLRLATKERGKTTWHNVTVWSEQAELCNKYLEKGSKVVVDGRLEYRTSMVNDINITTPEVVANHVQFM